MAKEPDSITHTRDRRAQIKEDYEQEEREHQADENKEAALQVAKKRKMQEEENQLLTKHAALVHDGETREMLLQRIRDMREDVPKEPEPAKPNLTPHQQEVLNVEQQAGREAVAKAEKEQERNREALRKIAAEIQEREGTMTTVHTPNPGMEEQFPTQGAALGKKK